MKGAHGILAKLGAAAMAWLDADSQPEVSFDVSPACCSQTRPVKDDGQAVARVVCKVAWRKYDWTALEKACDGSSGVGRYGVVHLMKRASPAGGKEQVRT
jgi:hypothetical protein